MIRKIFILCFLLLTKLSISHSQCNFEDAIFNITPGDRDYLRYFYFMNRFESATVEYWAGEFRICSHGDEERILVKKMIPDERNTLIKGDSIQGEDQKLIKYTRTDDFIIPDGGEIRFFRMIAALSHCSGSFPEVPEEGYPGRIDYFWHVGKGNILDKTEFVIKLKDSKTGSDLISIDSVGIDTVSTNHLAARYGTNPDMVNHTFKIPENYWGDSVYIQVSPRRWGSTPFGMPFRVFWMWISQSSIAGFDTAGIYNKMTICDSAEFELLRNIYFAELIDYCDNNRTSSGFLPDAVHFKILNENQDSIFQERYYELQMKTDSTRIYKEIRDTSGQKKPPYKPQLLSLRNIPANSAKIQDVRPLPAESASEITIFNTQPGKNYAISVMDIEGNIIKDLWRGILINGEKIEADLSGINSGFYLLLLRDDGNSVFDYRKLTVDK